jgi:ribosomal protein L28
MKKGSLGFPFLLSGAGEESRTLDLNLGKVALYQLSYSRIAHLRLSATAMRAQV